MFLVSNLKLKSKTMLNILSSVFVFKVERNSSFRKHDQEVIYRLSKTTFKFTMIKNKMYVFIKQKGKALSSLLVVQVERMLNVNLLLG